MGFRSTRLIIDSKLKNVALVGKAVNELCSSVRMHDVEAFQIELCVVEAVTNSIKHAYGLKSGQQVEVVLTIGSDELFVNIFDTGTPMDPRLLEKKRVFSSLFDAGDLASTPEGGRGLAIIKEIMDNVTYTSKEGRNCLAMTKKLASSSQK